jgi:hypothetical protein
MISERSDDFALKEGQGRLRAAVIKFKGVVRSEALLSCPFPLLVSSLPMAFLLPFGAAMCGS